MHLHDSEGVERDVISKDALFVPSYNQDVFSLVTGEKPPDKVRLGFRPGAFHRRANVRGAFHLEPFSVQAATSQ